QDMLNTMKNWNADGYTPLTEVLYEAMLYFKGEAPVYGGLGADAIEGTTTLTDGSTTKYKSPVDQNAADCERQFIILLSDGQPYGDTDANARVEALPGFLGTDGTTGCFDTYGSTNGMCLDDLTKYMNEVGVDVALNDGVYGSPANAELTGVIAQDVKISTYTVGFDIDSALLTDAGHQGAGPDGYKPVADANDLLQVLIDLIEEIKDIDTTFASPAVSVNAYNRTTHRADLYFTLFKPSNRPHWDGNFKRFKLRFDGAGVPEIVDVNNNPAIDPSTGFFAASAQSYWTSAADAPDGSQTEVGGAAGKLFTGATLATSRKVYTNLVSNVLTATGNRIEDTNVNLTDAIMGVTGVDKTNLINWARGVDVTDDDGDGDSTDARRIMGDPLHAQPALVEYADGETTDPYIVAYAATNDGYLHAFDTRSSVTTAGKEKFAFIPKELLSDLNTIFVNTNGNKHYGLDGTVTSWINDVDKDGIIEAGDRVIIYFGMRRGGRNYYAMDVTNPDAPEVLWTIYGGLDAAGNPGLGDFTELGQTWSTPQLRKIRLDGSDVQVLIFAAGYDVDQDNATTRSADNMGRGIYIINATTGALLWRMGPDAGANLTDANMIYSIPSDIAAADASGDGYVDHLYVGDMGGQLWRLDIDNNAGESTANINNIITGGRIADLADATAVSNRRFYYPPDVAILKDIYDASYLSVLITSGNRSHPLNTTVQDRVFMIRDLPVFGKPATYTTITVNDSTQELFDTTDNLIGQGSVTQRTDSLTALQGSNGWYINFDLAKGEKGLTKPLIFSGDAFFASYEPADPSVPSLDCGPNEGTGYLYHISVENGTPVENYDLTVNASEDDLTREDRRKTLTRSGIPADPTLIIPSGGAAICVGTECDRAEDAGTHKRVYWFEE
ncbi:MAG: PilC/PilY family type IV pilus protein, partial [Gammaproteobacteria bacterium]|nr:PilC/PilY family type IV pilus protein [Gammaproteobacteria bacterium]